MEILTRCTLCNSMDIISISLTKNICKCKNCGFFFDNPRPAPDEIRMYYSKNEKYAEWLMELNKREYMWKRRLRLIKSYKKKGSLLDVGAGIGQFLKLARNEYDVFGTEISESAITIANNKFGINLIKGEIENISLDRKFDIITLIHVLEHVSSPSSTLNKCKKMLKSDGIIVIAVPNDVFLYRSLFLRMMSLTKYGQKILYSLHLRREISENWQKIVLDGSMNEIHLSHFSPSILEKFIKDNNLEILESTLDPYRPISNLVKLFDLRYKLSKLFLRIFNRNIYDTIFIIVRLKK